MPVRNDRHRFFLRSLNLQISTADLRCAAINRPRRSLGADAVFRCNPLTLLVFIPNRTVANVSRFPHGGIYASTDHPFPPKADREHALQTIRTLPHRLWQQFGGIVLAPSVVDPSYADSQVAAIYRTSSGPAPEPPSAQRPA